jgi:phage-related protein
LLNFIAAIREKLPEIADSGWKFIIAWIDAMKGAVQENLPVLMDSVRELGLAIIKGILQGLLEGQEDAKQAIIDVAKMLVEGFKEFLGIHSPSSVFITIAGDIVKGIVLGIQNGITSAKNVMLDLANKLVDALKGKYESMFSAGRDLVSGLVNGIQGYISRAVESARSLASAVLDSIKNTLRIHSPSAETYDAGKYVDEGLALGIKTFAKNVIGEVTTLGKGVVDEFTNVLSGISNTIDSDMNLVPTITPVVDMSNVDSTLGQIKSNYGLPVLAGGALSTASNISARSNAPTGEISQEQPTGQSPSVVSFTQNNYSPKELSRIDIYRQTKNQLFLAKKGLVNSL